MIRYIDADELVNRLPDDLPYKSSVKRVLIQAPTANAAPIADTLRELEIRLTREVGTYLSYSIINVADMFKLINKIAEEILEETK